MRILVCRRPGGAFGFISDSWINAFRSAGFKAVRWDGKLESWKSFKPDLYIGCSGHRQPIPPKSMRNAKVAIHVNPYGPIKVEPAINEQHAAISWVKSMKPNAVFGYGFEKDRKFWSYWDRDGIPWVPMPCAGDATQFRPASHGRADIVYIGGRWTYKAKSIDKFLLPVLRDRGLSHLLYGWGEWPPELKVREAADIDVPRILASARVGPCVSEPHTLAHGIDIPERVFKVILSGAVAVHDPVPGIEDVLSSVLVSMDPESYRAEIKSQCRNGNSSLLKKQYDEVLGSHTYHHRLSGLCTNLGFKVEARALWEVVKGMRHDV